MFITNTLNGCHQMLTACLLPLVSIMCLMSNAPHASRSGTAEAFTLDDYEPGRNYKLSAARISSRKRFKLVGLVRAIN
ncbi:hypothetical protein O9992_30075 [Vibrio lentus]|nr:hypothetical protein [Vibrio lentus]